MFPLVVPGSRRLRRPPLGWRIRARQRGTRPVLREHRRRVAGNPEAAHPLNLAM